MLTMSQALSFTPRFDCTHSSMPCAGETVRFTADRLAVELVLGFRPGIDRLVVEAGAAAGGSRRLETTEEAGNAVVIDGQGRRIVLEGVALADLAPGDIALAASA